MSNKNTIIPITLEERMQIPSEDQKVIASLKNVSVTFGEGIRKIQAVKDASLNIYEGEVLGLVGESGSGKSTLGNALMGLLTRKEGVVKILDRELPKSHKKIKGELYKYKVNKMQMIFQDPSNSLNPHKNIYKVISEGLDNINTKEVYIKIFDDETVFKYSQICKEYKYKIPYIDELKKSLDDKEKDLEKYKVEIYDNLLKEVKGKYPQLETFIKVRLLEREGFTNGKMGTKAIKKKIVIETLKSVGLSERVLGRYPLEFSGGQQQRIGISRAVVLRPKLLVADEPISALDVSIQAQVINIFNELKRKMNLSILLIAHDLRMIEYISDRIAVMYKGVIVEIGTKKEIMTDAIHPYTKSLLAAIPSIDSGKKSLSNVFYDPEQHKYDEENQPSWFQVGSKGKRFVLGTKEEIQRWMEESNV